MRSSIVALICSAVALVALTALGLNVPAETMVRADPQNPTAAVSEGVTVSGGAAASEGATPELIGPRLIALAGPQAPSVPVLALRSARPIPATTQTSTQPLRLRVPAIDIDSPIVAAGVDASGQFDVPDPSLVGWYEHGAMPGDQGAAILAAHVDLGHIPGVFFTLDDVLPGDRVHVDFDDGTTRSFEVVDDVLYDKTALPEQELFRRDGDPVLQLVTCGGTYDPVTHHYLGNRIVTARALD